MFDSDEFTQLLEADISTMTPAELLARIALLDRWQRQATADLRHLLEANPEVVAQHPELQEELDYLRTLDLEEISDPGS